MMKLIYDRRIRNILLFSILAVCWGWVGRLVIVYGEIRLLTNSVWPAVLMHTMRNAFIDTLILKKFIEIRAGYSFLMMPSPDGIFSIVFTGIIGFWLYRIRVKSMSS